MYTYKITYSYIEKGRRVKEYDLFRGKDTQEAVDICRAENIHYFSEQFGRIESVYIELTDCWSQRNDWE